MAHTFIETIPPRHASHRGQYARNPTLSTQSTNLDPAPCQRHILARSPPPATYRFTISPGCPMYQFVLSRVCGRYHSPVPPASPFSNPEDVASRTMRHLLPEVGAFGTTFSSATLPLPVRSASHPGTKWRRPTPTAYVCAQQAQRSRRGLSIFSARLRPRPRPRRCAPPTCSSLGSPVWAQIPVAASSGRSLAAFNHIPTPPLRPRLWPTRHPRSPSLPEIPSQLACLHTSSAPSHDIERTVVNGANPRLESRSRPRTPSCVHVGRPSFQRTKPVAFESRPFISGRHDCALGPV